MAHSTKLSLKNLTPAARRALLEKEGWLNRDDQEALSQVTVLDWVAHLNGMVENVIDEFPMPLGIATGFIVNGRERLVPMVTEERTVIAAASKAASLCFPEGFTSKFSRPVAVAQLFYPRPDDPSAALERVRRAAPAVVAALRTGDRMVARGGGPFSLAARLTESGRGAQLTVELRIDVRDAMGANAATETGHRAGVLLKQALGALPLAVICGNDVPERRAVARAVWRAKTLGEDLARRSAGDRDAVGIRGLGRAGIERVLDLQAWAEADPARAVTHMKGVMNGVTAVALATGQDTRAIEAGVWTQAGRAGVCRPLTSYQLTPDGDLVGQLAIPLAIGTVGGATGHPMARFARELAGLGGGSDDARALSEIMAAVGLAQNFAALWSLANEGILASHEKLGRKKRNRPR